MSSARDRCIGIQEVTTAFSVTWLVMANLVGLLLALLLLRPGLNDMVSPFTYGRWVPVHMDWQLYGWCSLPLLGILYRLYLDGLRNQAFWTATGLSLWSIGLLAGGISWLNGGATGKLFLDWSGIAGSLFGAALVGNWAILALAWLSGLTSHRKEKLLDAGSLVRIAFLISLPAVPIVLLHTSDPSVYPPVNPDSGGATGHSLLASSLGIVFLMGLFPGLLLGLEKKETGRADLLTRVYWIVFLLSIFTYLAMHHGNASNHEWNQIIGLGSLLVWPGLVAAYWSCYSWSKDSGKWRLAFLFWWGLLAVDGWSIFLPGGLEVLKFTNALVAHSHLAMGGMVSALNILLLSETGGSGRVRQAFKSKFSFWFWNLGCLLYVVSMTLQGWHEGTNPGTLFAFDAYSETSYTIRLIAGTSMLVASANWMIRMFAGSNKSSSPPQQQEAI